jgi:hypothetical protein
MTKRDNDDLAAALAGLHGGKHHEPDEQAHDTSHGDHVHLDGVHDAPPQSVPAPVPPTAAAEFRAGSRPGGTTPPSPAPPAQRGGRPAAPSGSTGARSPLPGAPPKPPVSSAPPAAPAKAAGSPRLQRPASAAPVRPASPISPASRRPAVPTARQERPEAPARPASPSGPVRPAAPIAVSGVGITSPPADRGGARHTPPPAAADPEAHEREVAQQADAMAHVVEDDDSVSVPPPPLEYLGHTHPHHPVHAGPRAAVVPKYQNLEYRRTLIPILLTAGLCLVVMGFTKWVCAPDTLLGAQPVWMTIVLFTFGALSFALGLVNMVQVKALMERAPAGRS